MIDKETRDVWRLWAIDARCTGCRGTAAACDYARMTRVACCPECDHQRDLHGGTLTLLDALDEAEQDSRRWKQVAKNWSEDAAVLEQQVARVRALADKWEEMAVSAVEDGFGLKRENWRGWPFVAQIRAALDGKALGGAL